MKSREMQLAQDSQTHISTSVHPVLFLQGRVEGKSSKEERRSTLESLITLFQARTRTHVIFPHYYIHNSFGTISTMSL